MESQYGMGLGGDLRHYVDGRPLFPAISLPPDHLHRPLPNPYDMLIFRSDTLVDAGGAPIDGGGGAGRWPRQETLTLLDIRSRLDPKFKEANHKGPLWDEVSRIMSQEHGYQRSGKKCREKFENLYKYYKKTKEGKAGRQDGKHYRFFRQLEALYGDTATSSATHLHGGAAANNTSTNFHYNNFPNTNDQEPYHPLSKISDISIPDSCDYDTTSSYCSDSNVAAAAAANDDGDDDARMKRRRGKGRSLKAKIEASIDAQMKTMMDKQQLWMEKMTTIIEGKEQDRLLREEQWRKQDAARIDGEQKMWAAERAWLESRDAALMEAFNKLAGKEHEPRAPPPPSGGVMWTESDVTKLIQLRSGMELRFLENGMSEESAWDEIAAKMAVSGGGGRSGSMCREKWDNLISDYLIKCGKKRKDNAKGFTYSYDSISDDGVEGAMRRLNAGSSGDHVNDGIFRYFVGDSYQRL